MLPNSRFIPSSSSESHHVHHHHSRPRASSTASQHKPKSNFLSRFMTPTPSKPPYTKPSSASLPHLPPIGQRIKRKPLVSDHGVEPTLSDPRFTAPMTTAAITETMVISSAIEENETMKKQQQAGTGSIRGFGKFFKKLGKPAEDDFDLSWPMHDPSTNPSSSPHPASDLMVRHHPHIPLASPPPVDHHVPPYSSFTPPSREEDVAAAAIRDSLPLSTYRASSTNLNNIQPKYSHSTPTTKKSDGQSQPSSIPRMEDVYPSHDPFRSRWSNASTHKSSGSYSLYSTFGTESYCSSEFVDAEEKFNSAANDTTDDPPKPVSQHEMHSSQAMDPNEDVSDSQSDISEEHDVFVDATGCSQEEIERELKERKLSKRLSGGHYGSAGGLVFSIVTPPPIPPKSHHRRPPEDIVNAMLNWKRQSLPGRRASQGSSLSQGASITIVIDENQEPEADSGKILMPSAADNEREKRNESLEIFSQAVNEALSGMTLAPQLKPDQEDDQTQLTVEAKTAAQRLWNEDEAFMERERVAEWLGSAKPLNAKTLVLYMENFDFRTLRLDTAFRKLCGKLYFKAEAQQIDRILEAFANRYWSCNPRCLFGSADVVYAIVYSLLLLNTDLHVARGNYARMTRQAFVKNTMATIQDQRQGAANSGTVQLSRAWEAEVEAYLKDLYVSVKQHQILQSLPKHLDTRPVLEKRSSVMLGGARRVVDFKRSVGNMVRKTARESMLFPDDFEARSSTSSGQQSPLTPSSPPPPRSPRRSSFSSTLSATSSGSHPTRGLLSPHPQPMMHFMNTHASALFSNQPPYLKEGVVMRKHLLESAVHKAKHRDWRECFMVVTEGELRMYALQSNDTPERKSMLRSSSASFAHLADSLKLNSNSIHAAPSSFGGVPSNQWASTCQLLSTIKLNHSLSNVLPPPGYNRQRPHVFALQQSNGGVYLFQAGSAEQVSEWVATCNYWAARESKEPLSGGVSNMEYGWGNCLNDVIMDLDDVDQGQVIPGSHTRDADHITLYDWRAPAPPMVSSTLSEKDQRDALQRHLQVLNYDINNHRDLKKKILVKFPSKSNNNTKALSNWEAKSKYLLHEIIKYQNYCDILEKCILQHTNGATDDPVKPASPSTDYQNGHTALTNAMDDKLQLFAI
ncbi:uncharacterized protein BYT42DRAFT_609341 [Radiomyces spectabilis]|uniref:uncharacterized protein n=1 Tax=Radiomyces spectabilis TaxID=64574 RepID=UPI0022202390|nr:uncharacterized protein BYT42DRAFT_609341 [Radiomyces spectabilis]KAI8393557.1 hypothetical protein BYT42DRAFT_609341 [Radiomyces spectabilis]